MSLEKQISDLNGTLQEVKDVLSQIATALSTGASGETPVPQPAPKPAKKKRKAAPEPEADVSGDGSAAAAAEQDADGADVHPDGDDAARGELTLDDLRAKLKELKEAGGDPRKLLQHMKAKIISDLKPDQYEKCYAEAANWIRRNGKQAA